MGKLQSSSASGRSARASQWELLPEEKQFLEEGLRATRHKGHFQRVLCIWLRVSLGMTSEQIGVAIGWKASSVRRLQALFQRQGASVLEPKNRGGRRRENLSSTAEAQILKPFVRYTRAGYPLNVKALKLAYERAAGHPVPASTVYRMVKRHNYSRLLSRRQRPAT